MSKFNFVKVFKNLDGNVLSMGIAVVAIVIVGILIFTNGSSGQFLDKIKNFGGTSKDDIAKKGIDYINNSILSGQTAILVSSSEESGLVKIRISIGGNEFDSYMSKDGKLLFPEAIKLEQTLTDQQPAGESPEPNPEATLPPEELTKFIACLKKADFVIYGANWCGYTKQLVAMLGSWDVIKPIYVECTENEKLCQEKGVKGYPTILVKGKEYQKSRTFVDFAETANCEIPLGAEAVPQNTTSGGCQ